MMRIIRTLAAGLPLLVLLAGCGASEMDQARETLRNRPSIETAVTRYEEMTKRIRTQLSDKLAVTGWEELDTGTDAGCAEPFTNMDGESRVLNRWVAPGTLTKQQWQRAREIFSSISSEYGFAPPTVVVDQPDEHKIVSTNDDDARYIFRNAEVTVLSLITGCHWPEARKRTEQGAAAKAGDPAAYHLYPRSLATEVNLPPNAVARTAGSGHRN